MLHKMKKHAFWITAVGYWVLLAALANLSQNYEMDVGLAAVMPLLFFAVPYFFLPTLIFVSYQSGSGPAPLFYALSRYWSRKRPVLIGNVLFSGVLLLFLM